MRFVPIKTAEQQSILMLHRARDLLIRQRIQLVNALRAHLAEFGLVAEKGREGIAELSAIVTDESNERVLPSAMKQALQAVLDQLAALQQQIGGLDRIIQSQHLMSETSRRLESIPGIGVITATAIAATEPTRAPSGQAETLRPGSGWSRASIQQEARSGWAAFPSKATAISGGCS